jgi:hypothetical protein
MRTECLFEAAEFSALGSHASEIIADVRAEVHGRVHP